MPSFLIPVPSVETCGNVKSLSGLVLYTVVRRHVDQGGLGVGGVWLCQFLRYRASFPMVSNAIQYYLLVIADSAPQNLHKGYIERQSRQVRYIERISQMGKSNTSVAAIVAITATQFTELSALGLADSEAERGQGEKRGALITWCVDHGVNTANHSGSGAKRSLSLEQVKVFKKEALVQRLSDDAQALYALGGTKAAGRVAADNEGNTHNEKGVARNFQFYDKFLNAVLKEIQNGIESRKITAARIAATGSGNRNLVTFINEEGGKMYRRSFKDEGINLPDGNDAEGLQGKIKDLLVYVGGTIPVIKD